MREAGLSAWEILKAIILPHRDLQDIALFMPKSAKIDLINGQRAVALQRLGGFRRLFRLRS